MPFFARIPRSKKIVTERDMDNFLVGHAVTQHLSSEARTSIKKGLKKLFE